MGSANCICFVLFLLLLLLFCGERGVIIGGRGPVRGEESSSACVWNIVFWKAHQDMIHSSLL